MDEIVSSEFVFIEQMMKGGCFIRMWRRGGRDNPDPCPGPVLAGGRS